MVHPVASKMRVMMSWLIFLTGSALTRADGSAVSFGDVAKASFDVEEFSRVVVPFLQKHCYDCHGPEVQEGKLSLHKVSGGRLRFSKDVHLWSQVLERLATGNMPPASEPRPKRNDSARVAAWIRRSLVAAGHAELEFPRKGNLVPHELLFGPSANLAAKPASPGRIWRVSPQQYYSPWINAGIVAPPGGLGAMHSESYPYQRDRLLIPAPFGLHGGRGLQDFALLYRIDEAEMEQLLINARVLADRLIGVHRNEGAENDEAPPRRLHQVDEDEEAAKRQKGLRIFSTIFNATAKPSPSEIGTALTLAFQVALHRDPTNEEQAGYTTFFNSQLDKFGNRIGLKNVIASVVLHPESLFRLELGAGPADRYGRVRLAPRELAFAIAYALTDLPPDKVLVEAAASGKLQSREDVARQVRRLLDGPEIPRLSQPDPFGRKLETPLNDRKISKPRILRFFREYFDYSSAVAVFKDGDAEDPALPYYRRRMVENTDALVQSVLERDRNVLRELLTTNQFYEVSPAGGPDVEKMNAEYGFLQQGNMWFRKFEMPRKQRSGILTQPSWLIAHSLASDNDAVRRGKWVRERLLGGAVPEVPVTVEAKVPDEPNQPLRQRLRVTRQRYCWQCHQRMDPLGLAFEMFDDWGRFRTTEGKKVRKSRLPPADGEKGRLVDSTGAIVDSGDPVLDGKIGDAIELVRRLADSKHGHQVFVRHAFRYWMGRNETPEDALTLQNAYHAYQGNGGSMKALIVSLLTSDSFLYRRKLP